MTDQKITEQRLIDLEMRISRLEKAISSSSAESIKTPGGKKSSAREFLLGKQIKTETQKVVAFGYYLEHVEGMDSFNVEDLEAVFMSAKEKRPKNMNDAVNKNIARGFLMEASEKKNAKKAWVLTSTGEKYVEEELSKVTS